MRQLAKEKCNSRLAFITRQVKNCNSFELIPAQDLREVESDEDTFCVAIGAPIGSTLNVPHADTVAPKYELFVKSSGGPMTVCCTLDPLFMVVSRYFS